MDFKKTYISECKCGIRKFHVPFLIFETFPKTWTKIDRIIVIDWCKTSLNSLSYVLPHSKTVIGGYQIRNK